MNPQFKINIPEELVIHHTGGIVDTSNQTFEIVNEFHRNNPDVWLGYYSSLGFAIGYHYFLDKKGKLTQGRLDTDIGAHTKGRNAKSLAICLAGNFDLTLPTQEQVIGLSKWLISKSLQYTIPIQKVGPHRKYANKTCYGSRLSDDWARNLIVNYQGSEFGEREC